MVLMVLEQAPEPLPPKYRMSDLTTLIAILLVKLRTTVRISVSENLSLGQPRTSLAKRSAPTGNGGCGQPVKSALPGLNISPCGSG